MAFDHIKDDVRIGALEHDKRRTSLDKSWSGPFGADRIRLVD
jgi:hypothetical protein